jgi:hypothetical protein
VVKRIASTSFDTTLHVFMMNFWEVHQQSAAALFFFGQQLAMDGAYGIGCSLAGRSRSGFLIF